MYSVIFYPAADWMKRPPCSRKSADKQ